MKTTIAILMALFLFACNTKEDNFDWKTADAGVVFDTTPQPVRQFKTITYYKVVKDLKEVQEMETDSHTEVNIVQSIWDGDLKTQTVPDVHTNTKYFIIYTDKTMDQVDRNTFLTSSKGDSIPFTYQQEIQ